MEEFARSFNNADALFVADIYAASEDPMEGITSEALTEAIKRYGHKNANYIGALDSAAEVLKERVGEGDMVITLGAGPVYRVGEQLLALLGGREQATAT
jgi:UDP-N-acetylmuramate--alanine ligase